MPDLNHEENPLPNDVQLPLRAAGRFLFAGREKHFVKMVVYGPFPDAMSVGGTWLPELSRLKEDLDAIVAAGFNAIRIYEKPTSELVALCRERALRVWFGLPWPSHFEFLGSRAGREGLFRQACRELVAATIQFKGEPVVGGIFVANEIPVEMVRWLGWRRTRRALEQMIAEGQAADASRIFTYANFPPTEWITPRNVNVVAFNIYLNVEEDYVKYLRHLQLIAGDKPLLISEVGVDVPSGGESEQAEVFDWSFRSAVECGVSGVCWFTWSGSWRMANGEANTGWDFGLQGADGTRRLALQGSRRILETCEIKRPEKIRDSVAVVVCTRNGGQRIARCIESLLASRHRIDEIVVVDDGSTDDTSEIANRYRPQGVRVLTIAPSGLSHARNHGAQASSARWICYTDDDCKVDEDWIAALLDSAVRYGWDAVGGPNITPPREGEATPREVILDHGVGTASAVLLTDCEAEHLPGCNLMIRRDAFENVGGFRATYVTAGDDVDICWRLRDAGYVLGYQPTAMVWHDRRATFGAYLRQQFGYGRAEALLADDWPDRVGAGGARWNGVLYPAVGGARDPRGIYGSAFGLAAYPKLVPAQAHEDDSEWREQSLALEKLPFFWRFTGRMMYRLQPFARALGRWRGGQALRLPPLRMGGRSLDYGNHSRDVRWFDFLDTAPDRVELINGMARAFAQRGWSVRMDDGRRWWDLELTSPDVHAPNLLVHLVTVMEYDGVNHSRHFGVRVIAPELQKVKAAMSIVELVMV